MTVADQLAERLEKAVVVVDGAKMVPLYLAEKAVLNVMRLEQELKDAAARASDSSWETERYRQIERDNWVADGGWSR